MILFAEDIDTALAGQEVSPQKYHSIHIGLDSQSITNDKKVTRNNSSQPSGRNYSYASQETREKVDEFAIKAAMSEISCQYPNKEIEQMEHNNPGYDISVKKDGKVAAYVEVKGTTNSKPIFYMSENERIFSERNAEKYLLIIVYKINLETEKYELFTYRGAVNNNKFKLEPFQWLVKVNLNTIA